MSNLNENEMDVEEVEDRVNSDDDLEEDEEEEDSSEDEAGEDGRREIGGGIREGRRTERF